MTEKVKLLMIEDNKEVLELNGKMLARRGYEFRTAGTLRDARRVLSDFSPDMIILDILLPDGNGLDFCTELRTKTDAPILMLSGLKEQEDIVNGLMTGGDDYMTKPYKIAELEAKVVAFLRREKRNTAALREEHNKPPDRITRGPLTLDIVSMRALLNGEDVVLTPREFAILLVLVRNEGREISGEQLYGLAWGMNAVDDTRAVRQQVSRIRIKLKTDEHQAFSISAERRKGYAFVMNKN